MRSRSTLILVALTILFAFAAAGCGNSDSSSEVESVPYIDAPAQPKAATHSNGSADKSLDMNDAMRTARKQCEEAASAIADEDAKAATLAACKNFK